MSKIVFILGAGASKEAGAPLMCEFLNCAYDLWQLKMVPDSIEEFSKVFNAIGALQSVHSKSQLDIRNVESVFAAFEMAKLLNKYPNLDELRITEQIDAMKILIVKTLGKSIKFSYNNESGLIIPKPYIEFVNLLKFLAKESNIKYSLSVFTFNYDILLDLACLKEDIPVNYCLDSEQGNNGLCVLKLHGSTNWGYCSKCNKVIPYDLKGYLNGLRLDSDGRNIYPLYLDVSTRFNEFTHCEHKVFPIPVIVPPTWNKSDYHKQIANVWRRAAFELQDAEHIFVIGYSLPPTDAFFKYLYALGTVGQNPLKSFIVFDPDKERVSPRFEDMLGPGVKDIYKCENKLFSEAISIIKDKFPPEEKRNFYARN